jgi:hypothetical protein
MDRPVKRFLAASIMTAAACIACDRLYADPVTTSGPTPGIDSGFITPRTPPVPCPKFDAFENSPCERNAAICEFGHSSDPQCNSIYVCVTDSSYGLYWTEQTPPHDCPYKCPPEEQIVDGAPCDLAPPGDSSTTPEEAELQCTTARATCACTTGRDAAHSHPRRWVCRPPSSPGCPLPRPLLNQICVGESVCDYGACDFKRGARMVCREDVWQIEEARCD